ncbi:MAG: flavodoxin family protein [Candidatus Thorarchaeota archaeon]|nr:flavodoxin family protein [Candidatus Thorarchaeota archaeon]
MGGREACPLGGPQSGGARQELPKRRSIRPLGRACEVASGLLIVGVSGSPKKAKSSTRFLLQKALEAASEVLNTGPGGESSTLILDLSEYTIRRCTGCDLCVRKKPCPESEMDDFPKLEEKLRMADAIIIAAPSYFTSVPGVLKDFMDRSRSMKMQDHQLRDKVFGAITFAGLRYGGQEAVIDLLNRYALAHGMIVVGGVGSPVRQGPFGSGSLQTDEGKWRTAETDTLAVESSQQLGRRVAEIVRRLKA